MDKKRILGKTTEYSTANADVNNEPGPSPPKPLKTIDLTISDLEAIRGPRPSPKTSETKDEQDGATGDPNEVHQNDSTIVDGRYELIRCLGAGSMGAVYLVKHVNLGKLFALKTINPEIADIKELVSRFQREADACSRLNHPNCISVTDFGRTKDNNLYLIMEYVEGTLLSDLADQGPIPVEQALEYARQVLLGLKHAHSEGLIHRDIKLENIVKSARDDDQVIIKILDFGIAKEPPKNSNNANITVAGTVLGTPQYMAPEQITDAPIDERVDLYATGVMLLKMISGQPVFDHENYIDIFTEKLQYPAPTLSALTSKPFPNVLEEFIAKALERNPDDRYSNADEMLAALETVASSITITKGEKKAGRATNLLKLSKQTANMVLAHGAAIMKSIAKNGGVFFKRVGDEFARWYTCQEIGPASLKHRLLGLYSTPVGRIVLIRTIAVMTLLLVVLIALFSKPDDLDSPQNAAADASSFFGLFGADSSGGLGNGVASPNDSSLIEATLLLDQKKCRQAEKRIGESPNQTDARVLYLHGRIKMCLGQVDKALEYYKKVVASDKAYQTDSRILEDAKKMVGNHSVRDETLEFMALALGEAALPTMVHFASRHVNRKIRQRSRELVEKIGAIDQVELALSFELDLVQTRSCKEKREIIQKLVTLNDKKARQVLHRARMESDKHKCAQRDINQALSDMKNQNSQ